MKSYLPLVVGDVGILLKPPKHTKVRESWIYFCQTNIPEPTLLLDHNIVSKSTLSGRSYS